MSGGWEVIPDAEMPDVLAAVAEGRCVACYGPVNAHHGLYCCEHDDACEPGCTS